AAITALVVAVLALPRRPAPADETRAADSATEAPERSIARDAAAPPPAGVTAARATQTEMPAADTSEPLRVVQARPAKTPKPAKSLVAADVAAVASAIETVERREAAASAAKPVDVAPAATEPTPAPAAAHTIEPEPVTIVGCLELNL